MFGFATIRKEGFPNQQLDRVRWRSLIGEFPELRRIDFLDLYDGRYEVPDSAELIENGKKVGLFLWENGQIYVDGPYSMFALAKGIAGILDAKVFDSYGDEMIVAPEALPRPTGDRAVYWHQYYEELDMTGKDLISALEKTKAEIARLVGDMIPKSQMTTRQIPVAKLFTTMSGEIADEVHEWPNATLGAGFRHLALYFFNDRLIGNRWTAQKPAETAPVERKPRWKFW